MKKALLILAMLSLTGMAYADSDGDDVGPVGPQGIQGIQGIAGPIGPKGATGAAGINGTTGTAGSAGTNGINGVAGVAGSPGMAGVNGKTGATGLTGAQGVQGIQGNPADVPAIDPRLDVEIREYDSQHWSLSSFASFGMQDSTSRYIVGEKLTLKLGKSAEQREIDRLKKLLGVR